MRIPPMLGHWFVISMCWAATPAFTQEHHKDHSAADLNRQFRDLNLDVQKFIRRFQTDSREIFAQRQAIVQAVDLRPGLAVADIGAGTGLFTWMFAEKVGPKGTVYAVEIAPAFLKSIGEQARQRGLDKVVKTVRSTQETTNLAPGSTDVAFVCATYHHFEHPGKVLASIHRALRPGGRLVVIDFDLRKDSRAFVRERARAPKEVYFREIEAAGFTQVKATPPLNLKENFFAVFQRRELDINSSNRTIKDRPMWGGPNQAPPFSRSGDAGRVRSDGWRLLTAALSWKIALVGEALSVTKPWIFAEGIAQQRGTCFPGRRSTWHHEEGTMKRWSWVASALGTLLVAAVIAVAAQEPREDQAQEPRTTDQPQMKGLMMRGMMPMMMEMHRQHAAMESQWEATDAGIFVLRPGQLLKYDGDLKLVKTVDLPKMSPPRMPHHGDEADEAEGGPKMKMDRGGMQPMMARMHGGLPTKLDVTRDAVFVSRGSSLLKFSHDLELQKRVDLPDAPPTMCPMCGPMMEQMRGRMRGGRDE